MAELKPCPFCGGGADWFWDGINQRWQIRCEDCTAVVSCDGLEDAMDAVEVVHGRWELYPSDRNIKCTNCKMEFLLIHMPYTRNYCPNCGAKMDGDGKCD